MRWAGAGLVACAVAGLACGSWPPGPPRAEPDRADPVIVDVAPPPPKVEIIPDPPKDPPDTVWIDGEWVWRGRRWEWKPGRWEAPPAGAAYATPEIVYLEHDRIGWLPGRWRATKRRGR